MGLGDSDGALGTVFEGSLGVDDRSGRVAGSFLGGHEYSTWRGGRDKSDRYAVLGGFDKTRRPRARRRSSSGLA